MLTVREQDHGASEQNIWSFFPAIALRFVLKYLSPCRHRRRCVAGGASPIVRVNAYMYEAALNLPSKRAARR